MEFRTFRDIYKKQLFETLLHFCIVVLESSFFYFSSFPFYTRLRKYIFKMFCNNFFLSGKWKLHYLHFTHFLWNQTIFDFRCRLSIGSLLLDYWNILQFLINYCKTCSTIINLKYLYKDLFKFWGGGGW